MPKIQYKEKILNGRADLIKYAHRSQYFLRIPTGNRKSPYSNFSLETEDLGTARESAVDVYIENKGKDPKRRQGKWLFETACQKFLQMKEEDVTTRDLTASSLDTYTQRMTQRIIPYATKIRGVRKLDDMDKSTWYEKYYKHYRSVKTKGRWNQPCEGLEVETINGDITTIREFLDWIVEEEMVDPRKIKKPERKEIDKDKTEDANPAFLPKEWDKFKEGLRKWEANQVGKPIRKSWENFDEEERQWKNRWLVNYIFFQYHLGARPHETRLLRLRDCEVDVVDGKKKGYVKIPKNTKTGKRTSVMNGNHLEKVIQHAKSGIDLRNRQVDEFNKMLHDRCSSWSDAKILRTYRRVNPNTMRWEHHPELGNDDLIMINPFKTQEKDIMFSVATIDGWYKEVIEKYCSFSDPYTIYSLRSTHVTHAVLRGVREGKSGSSIKILCADNLGTSDDEIDDTYRRVNNILNADLLGFHNDNPIILKDSKGREIVFRPELDDETFDYLRN